jgi:hypothetical protein
MGSAVAPKKKIKREAQEKNNELGKKSTGKKKA